MELFICKNLHWETNSNVLYIKGECYKVKNNALDFYQVIESNKAFDISKDLSQITVFYEKQKLISKKEESQYLNDDNIILSIPNSNQSIVIPLAHVESLIELPIAQIIYDKLGDCIDIITDHLYDLNDSSYHDLDDICTNLQNIQSFILSKFKKSDL